MKILVAIATYNRPIITDLCLRNLQQVRDSITKIIIYDDSSDAYNQKYLSDFADEVVRFESRQGIERSRARTFRDFLRKYKDYELLYLTDNDAIHDPDFAKTLREIFLAQEKSCTPIKPVGLFNSKFHQERIKGEAGSFYFYETCPGISMCFTRPMVQKIVDYLEDDPSAEFRYGWDMDWPKALNLPFMVPKTSYVEHFARDRFQSGMHSSNSGVDLKSALDDFERDRAINPSPYLRDTRLKVIKEILGDWNPLEKNISTLLANALKSIQEQEFLIAHDYLLRAKILDPENPDTLRFLSVVCALQFDFQEALEYIDATIKFAPDYAIAHSNRGNILRELGRFEEALMALDNAIYLQPSYAEAYMNRGNVLYEMADYQDAISWFDKAIALQSNYADAYSNKGNALVMLDRFEEAMQCFDQATAINPGFVDAYWHKAMMQLKLGEFESGWQNYEARWFKTNGLKFQYSEIPRLESLENISGKRVLIWAEQGLGDTLQFCRYIEPLFHLGAHITFAVPLPLKQTLASLSKFCNLVLLGEGGVNDFDTQSPLLSLPLIFNTRIDSIPKKIPYLYANEDKKLLYKKDIRSHDCLNVGLIWNGGFRADHPEMWAINKRRNIELDQIAVLKSMSGIDFYSLQKGDPAESELSARKNELWPDLIDCAPLLKDFSDTAALMENLDLIISVDTSSAHLAGALGKPVWILNRFDSCWRWLRDRGGSPWYPTAKIYQQKTPGDWEGVIARVKVDLTALVKINMPT
jgi:tetratricopeptide (TPR) repeat protein